MLFPRYVYTMTFIPEDLKAYCLLLLPLKASLQVSHWSRIRNEEENNNKGSVGGYGSKMCQGSRLIPPVPLTQLGHATPSWPTPPKNHKGTHLGHCPKSITIPCFLFQSPGCPPTGRAPHRQQRPRSYPVPAATHFLTCAGYRHIKLPTEQEEKALLPPCNYQISPKMRKN